MSSVIKSGDVIQFQYTKPSQTDPLEVALTGKFTVVNISRNLKCLLIEMIDKAGRSYIYSGLDHEIFGPGPESLIFKTQYQILLATDDESEKPQRPVDSSRDIGTLFSNALPTCIQ